MLILPKHKEIEVPCGQMTVGMIGRFRMDATNIHTGKKRELVPWFKNKMLDSGRNNLVTQNNWAYSGSKCHVGAGTNAALATDTALQTFVASTSTVQAQSFGAQSSPPYYGWSLITYRFAVGVATGNLSEVGVGWGTSGATLITRARIVDGMGDPTTITVLGDEVLDVTYELRYYPPLTPVNGTVTLNGITYNTVSTAAEVNNASTQGGNMGQTMGQYSLFTSDWQAYDGALGTIIQNPSGVSAACDNATQFNKAYVNNSYYVDMQCNCGITGWNLGNGIRSIRIRTNAGSFQTSFTAQGTGFTIPKTVNFTMIMVWRLAWIEGTIP